MRSPTTSKLPAFLAALALLFAARALQCGANLADVAAFELFVAAWVVLPGCAFYARWRESEEDGLAFFGMACATGYALQALGYTLFKVLGIPGAFALWPLLGLPWIVALVRGRRAAVRAELPSWGQLALLLLVLGFALERVEVEPGSAWFTRAVLDPLFHLANTLEFRQHWPLTDPRVASLPLNYHFLGYTTAAGANQVLGIPVAELALRTGSLLAPLLCLLQVWNCARAYCGRASAGIVATLLVAIGTNLSAAIELAAPGAAQFVNASHSLEVNVFVSKTSPAGLMLFASLMLLVRREFARGGALVPGCLLACALAGLKGSCTPVVIGGLALDLLVRWLRRDESRVRALRQFVALGCASSLFLVWLTAGSGSYASSVFRVAPLWTEMNSGMWMRATYAAGFERGAAPFGFALVLLLPWLAFALGPSLAGGLVVLVRGGKALLLEHLWLWGTLLAGLVLALSLGSPGHNELAFLHPGQFALAVLGADAFTRFGAQRRTALALLVLAAPFLLGALIKMRDNRFGEHEFAALEAQNLPERRALEWMREHTESDALFVLDSGSLYVSAFAGRRAFHESTAYTPAAFEGRWVKEGWTWTLLPPSRAPEIDTTKLRERVVGGVPGALEELRARVPQAGAVYLLFETGQVPPDAMLAPHSEKVFANEAFELWRERR